MAHNRKNPHVTAHEPRRLLYLCGSSCMLLQCLKPSDPIPPIVEFVMPETNEPPDPPPIGRDQVAQFAESKRRELLAYIQRSIGPALRAKLEPEDVLQEVIVAALESAAAFSVPGRHPFKLLCQMAEQRIIDAHRRHIAAKKRSADREVSLDAPVGDGVGIGFVNLLVASMTSPSRAFSRGQKELLLQEAIATLSDEQREVLRLRYVEGLPSKDVAERIGKSDGAVRVLLTRTLSKLQEMLVEGE